MNKEEFLSTGLLELYALGLTSPEESKEVKRFLNAHPELKKKLSQLKYSMKDYADQNIPQPKPRNTFSLNKSWTFLLMGSMVVLIGLQIYNQFKLNKSKRLVEELELAINDCNEQVENLLQNGDVYAMLTHSQTKVKRLITDYQAFSQVDVLFYFNQELGKVYCNPVSLKELSSKKQQYQVWADVDGEMVNMGLIENAEQHIQALLFHEHTESINITVEPYGGSEHPTLTQIVGTIII